MCDVQYDYCWRLVAVGGSEWLYVVARGIARVDSDCTPSEPTAPALITWTMCYYTVIDIFGTCLDNDICLQNMMHETRPKLTDKRFVILTMTQFLYACLYTHD